MFCDPSEKAYGSVAYLRTEDPSGKVEVAFLTARSRVAPKKQQPMPRLELCAALTGAQLPITSFCGPTRPLCSHDFSWIPDDFKVIVGTRVAEIQDLTDGGT